MRKARCGPVFQLCGLQPPGQPQERPQLDSLFIDTQDKRLVPGAQGKYNAISGAQGEDSCILCDCTVLQRGIKSRKCYSISFQLKLITFLELGKKIMKIAPCNLRQVIVKCAFVLRIFLIPLQSLCAQSHSTKTSHGISNSMKQYHRIPSFGYQDGDVLSRTVKARIVMNKTA